MRRALIAGSLCALLGLSAAMAQETLDMNGQDRFRYRILEWLRREPRKGLGAMGATVIVHGLNIARGQQVAAEINARGPGRAVFYPGDLGSLDEVGKLARAVLDAHPRIHLLINNAGIIGSSERRESADGYEQVFAVNYRSHFRLTRERCQALKAAAPRHRQCRGGRSVRWISTIRC